MINKKKLNNKLLTKSKSKILDGDEVEQTLTGTTPQTDTFDQSVVPMTAAAKKQASYEAEKTAILNNKK